MKNLQHFLFLAALCLSLQVFTTKAATTCTEGELTLTYHTDCFETNAYDSPYYKLIVNVEGGTLPYKVRFNGNIPIYVQEEGQTASIALLDGEGFNIEVTDAEGQSVFAEELERLPCASMCQNTELIVDIECQDNVWTVLKVTAENPNGKLTFEGYGDGSMLPQGYEYAITAIDEQGCRYTAFGVVTCSDEPLETIDDFGNTLPGEPVSINVLTNDSGDDLTLKGILVSPSCGEIVEVNTSTGKIVYVADADTHCTVDTFVYEVMDRHGNVSHSTVTIFIEQHSDLIVQVERDCTSAEETGVYTLNVIVVGGFPPYTISGSINEVMDKPGVTFAVITDGNPYEISVVDADGAEFFDAGGDTGCLNCFGGGFGGVSLNSFTQVLTCQCDGSVLVDFEKVLAAYDFSELDGEWEGADGSYHSLQNGDSVPFDAPYFAVYGFYDIYGDYYPIDMGCGTFYTFPELICDPPKPIAAHDDIIRMTQNQTIEFNVTKNDEGENLKIEIPSTSLQYGEILQSHPNGTIVYQGNQIGIEEFTYHLMGKNDCYETATVNIEILRSIKATWQRNCELWEEGLCKIELSVEGGTAPYQLTGATAATLMTASTLDITLPDNDHFHIDILDSAGNTFHLDERNMRTCADICEELAIIPHLECVMNGNEPAARFTYEVTGTNGDYDYKGTPYNQLLQNGESYVIEITTQKGCSQRMEGTVDCNFTSINSFPSTLTNFQITPNPNKGNFTLSLELKQAEMVDIEIIDITGRIQAKTRRHLQGSATFERNDLPSGLYFIRLSGKDWTWTEKMVVE